MTASTSLGKSAHSSSTQQVSHLLGAADVRALASQADIRPSKKLGQNFVTDPGTVRRIVQAAAVTPDSMVLEVGPGLGSLTLGLLETGARVCSVEIDPRLAALLPSTVERCMPQAVDRWELIQADALSLDPAQQPSLAQAAQLTLVSNLPYNLATPIVLTLLERFDNLTSCLVMVQKEVADRLSAKPGSKIYGAPSVKLAYYGQARLAGNIGRQVFWPVPNVDSALVSFHRHSPQSQLAEGSISERQLCFKLIDAAFAQRRKTLRAALKGLVSPEAFTQAGVDPAARGESLEIGQFVRLSQACRGQGA